MNLHISISIAFAVTLACLAVVLRARSVRRRGVWSEEALYFFVCAGVAAVLVSPALAGTSRVSFVEQSQSSGVDRVPSAMDQIGFAYASLWGVIEPAFWLLLIVALEVVARAWARAGGARVSAVQPSPKSRASADTTKSLILYLCLFVGPAVLLWIALRVAMADPALVLPANERIADAAFSYAYVLGWLAALLSLYCMPAQWVMPEWAHRSGGAHPWANQSPDAIFGPQRLAELGFPGDLFAFLAAATPWILAAVLLAWLGSSVRRPNRRDVE
jgi:hypothetical protein